MRILTLHNYYQWRGGEDQSFDDEASLLRERGQDILTYTRHNNEINTFSSARKAALFFYPTWSHRSYKEVKSMVRKLRPDVAHFHNFFPLISPSAIYACKEERVPVVLTLHDFRLLCPIGWFFHRDSICEKCLTYSLLRGVWHKCYHGSRIQTASIALMLMTHRFLKTWQKQVDLFVALTDFSRRKFIDGGVPKSKILIKPNYLHGAPGIGEKKQDYAIYVGRLSSEKGVDILLKAWRGIPNMPLKIVGDGPLRSSLEDFARNNRLTQVEFVGSVGLTKVLAYLQNARFLVMPSLWYETFGRVIMEAYATGTPVIASRLGAMADMVEEYQSGLLFERGDANDLAEKVKFAIEHEDEVLTWGNNARRIFEERFSPMAEYPRIMQVYEQVIQR